MLSLCTAFSTMLGIAGLYVMLAITSLGGIVAITVLYGFFSGVFIALPPVVMVRLAAD